MSFPTRVRISLAAGGLLLVAAVAPGPIAVPASAQAPKPETATPEQVDRESPPKRGSLPKRAAPRRSKNLLDPEAAHRQQQEFINNVAARLGVSPERLDGALKEAHIDQVNKAVVEGKLSREQADRVIEHVNRDHGLVQAPSRGASEPVAPLSDIQVSFKLDPRLTKSLYMGERWVSPPTYTGIQEGQFTVEARVDGVDTKGQAVDVSPEWTPADPTMVTVSPRRGKQVTITVHRAGDTSLRVTSQEISTELSIKAWENGTALQAEISPKAVKRIQAEQKP
jgi:hypothetical protein